VLEWQPLESQEILAVFRGGAPAEIDRSLLTLTVLNGTGTIGQAADAQAGLQAAGFTVDEIDDSPEVAVTEVRHAPGVRVAGELVARHLARGAVLVEDDSLDGGEVVVVTGPDFAGVLADPLDVPLVPSTVAGDPGGGSASTDGEPAATAGSGSGSTAGSGSGSGSAGDGGATTTVSTAPPPAPSTTAVGVVPVDVPAGGCPG
jgi:hypothetical protein